MENLPEIDFKVQQKLVEQIGQLVIRLVRLEAEVEYWRSKAASELNAKSDKLE